jgi:hypothetical protein
MSPRRKRVPPTITFEDSKLAIDTPIQRDKIVLAYKKAIQALNLECLDYRVSERRPPYCRYQSPGDIFCCKNNEMQLRSCIIKFHIEIVNLLAQALEIDDEIVTHNVKRRLEI